MLFVVLYTDPTICPWLLIAFTPDSIQPNPAGSFGRQSLRLYKTPFLRRAPF